MKGTVFILLPLLALSIIIFIYKPIFLNEFLIGGDWPYYFNEYILTFKIPEVWNSNWPTGLGGNQTIILPLKLYLHLVVMIFVNALGIPWSTVQKVFFFWLFLGLAIYSSYKLTKSWIGVLIYTSNTWILMVFSGGQMGIALAYAIVPLALKTLMNVIQDQKSKIKNPIITGLIFAIQVMFDVRVAFLTMLVAISYFVFYHFFVRRLKLKLLFIKYSLLIIVTLFFHAFWILPSIFVALKGGNVASIVDTSASSLEFLSFAKFENALSLLHPNWPENIFGKVAFMRLEFLVIPIVAFAFLFFRNSKSKIKKDRTILFFAILGLIGAFLAKGTQEPFGAIFSWLYSNISGFNLFRDPVKFYILVAISYSILIPHTLAQISKLKKIIPIVFIAFWVYLNLPFILNSNVGILKQRSVPSEYIRLKEFLLLDQNFSRTLWIPSVQRFAFVSDVHPALAYQDIFKTKKPKEEVFSSMAVKYVIVPYDSEGEIFLNDRKYDGKLYQKTIDEFSKVPWLKRVEGFGKIVVYEISNPKPHIWSSGDKLIFSEGFDSNWYAQVNGRKVYSKQYGGLNSFNIPNKEQNSAIFQYEPQKWANIGYVISGLTMISVVGLICIFLRKK